MERVKHLSHRGKDILVLDLTGSQSVEENIAILDKTQQIIMARPEASVRLLTILVNARYSSEAIARLNRFSVEVTPYIRASAAVGITGIKRVFYQTLSGLIGRKIQLFDTAERALDWLADQDE